MKKNLPFPDPQQHVRIACALVASFCAMMFYSTSVFSQAELIKDLNTQEDANTNEYSWLTDGNGTFYFVTKSKDLWKSNGSAATTVLVKAFDYIAEVKMVGSTLYLSADPNGDGAELWKSDGTEEGTVQVKDIYPGVGASLPQFMTDVNGTLYFSAVGTAGRELWKSNGTEAGTVQVKDIFPKKGGSNPTWMVHVNGVVFFAANDGQHGYELWRSDGTAQGTTLVKDIRTAVKIGSTPEQFTTANGLVYFIAGDDTSGRELWKSDGTEAGTTIVKDIRPGSTNGGVENLTAVNDHLFFSANDGVHGHELWKTDGTEMGTLMVKDMTPGPAGSHGENPFMFRIQNCTNVSGTLFFTAYQNNDYFVWKSDGTEAGTVPIAPCYGFGIGTPLTLFTEMNGHIYFFNEDAWGDDNFHLFKMDPDGGNIQALATFGLTDFYNSYAPQMVKVNNALYAAGKFDGFSGFKLIRSDGTPEGTVEMFDAIMLNNSSHPFGYTLLNGKVFFATNFYEEYWQEPLDDGVYVTDGTEAGTVKLINGTEIIDIEPVNNYMYAAVTGPWSSGFELHRTDGLNSGMVVSMPEVYGVNKLTGNNQGTLFFHNWEGKLWKSDGTQAGTMFLKQFNDISGTTSVKDLFLFRVKTEYNGEEFWRSNGTLNGTYKFKTIRTGYAYDSWQKPTINIRHVHYYVANDGVHGNEIWATRGALATTYMVHDINQLDNNIIGGNYEHDINALGSFRDSLYISALDNDGNWALYKSGGRGVQKIMNMNQVMQMADGGDKLYLFVQADNFIIELWSSDGTAAGTNMIANIGATTISDYDVIDNVLYFTPWYSNALWRSDGTECGTFQVETGTSYPTEIFAHNSKLFMTTVSGDVGVEPHLFNTVDAPASPCGTEMAYTSIAAEPEPIVTSYPNPFTNYFSVHVNGKESETARISVFTNYGSPVDEIRDMPVNTDHQIGASWPVGIYILKVYKGDELTTHMVVKK